MSNAHSELEVVNHPAPNQRNTEAEIQPNPTVRQQHHAESEKMVAGEGSFYPYSPSQSPAPNGAYGPPHQQLPPYTNDNPQQYTYNPPLQQQQPQLPISQEQAQPVLTGSDPICGMRRKVFWIVLVVVVIALIAVGVGAGVGVSMNKKGDSDNYTPYALETGAWNINNVPSSSFSGICTNNLDPKAVTGCGPLNLPFFINKVGDDYEISNSPITELNGFLNPPLSQEDMYEKNADSFDQAFGVEAFCVSHANVTIKLGRGKQFEITNNHYTKDVCELDNGQLSTAEQACNCEWFGFAPASAIGSI